MKIIIDARLYGPKHTGIGRYVANLVDSISKTDLSKKYSITLLIHPENLEYLQKKYGPKFCYLTSDVKHYSWQEQISLPILLYKQNADLVHFTHFNKPLFYFRSSVITIHDLIKNFYYGKETTTKWSFLYWPKYFMYRIFTYLNIKLNYIVVPSNFWKNYIVSHYNHPGNKIVTTYEAVDPIFQTQKPKNLAAKNYLVYTGNLYPHKNLQIVLVAIKSFPNLSLYVITKPGIFLDRFKRQIIENKLSMQIKFVDFPTDTVVKKIYSSALALVHPSLMEGFGLTGLEAMASGCPVISSNSSCLPEIYQDKVLYFEPNDANMLIKHIELLQKNKKIRSKLITDGYVYQKHFSWEKTAKQTLDFYDQILTKK